LSAGCHQVGSDKKRLHRVFISEVVRFEERGFELITPGFYRVFFRNKRLENSMRESFASDLRRVV
jgi:hypothetical protein